MEHDSLWEHDRSFGRFGTLCGLDEVGRGPLAGPVCAACVMLRDGVDIPYLNDSKKLTEKRREAIYRQLTENDIAYYGIGFGSVEEIDRLNILQATFLAMHRAYEDLRERFPSVAAPVLALVDGNQNPGLPLETRLLVGGDGKSAHIAAASVLAKVTRDHLMMEMAEKYPNYFFEKNKGYGSAQHYAMIEQYGVTPVHRMSFLKKLYPAGK